MHGGDPEPEPELGRLEPRAHCDVGRLWRLGGGVRSLRLLVGKIAKHDPRETRKKWDSCRRSPPRALGFGTLHYLAKEAGWVPSPGLAFNVEKALPTEPDVFELEPMLLPASRSCSCRPA